MHSLPRFFPRLLTAAGMVLMALSGQVLAHQSLDATAPEAGAALAQSPAEIGAEFDGQMRITQFEVSGPNGTVALTKTPDGEMADRFFAAPEQALTPGDYEVRWRGLSDDGHMMSEGFDFSVAP